MVTQRKSRRAKPLRLIQFGLGPIGCACVTALLSDARFKLVGAIDVDPAKVGRDVGEVAGIGKKTGVIVTADTAKFIRRARADAVLHTTSSSLPAVAPQLETLIRARVNIVSSTEELSYPWRRHPALSKRLDKLAAKHGVRLLGTGVNPGFVMDALPVMLATATLGVTEIRLTRRVDAALRRGPLQRKVGCGMSVGDFNKRARAGLIGHVGLVESLLMTAHGLGWQLTRFTDTIKPVVATRAIHTNHVSAKKGEVCGIRQNAVGVATDGKRITLSLEMSLGAKDPRDEIVITGTPDLHIVIPGGTRGDQATVACLINAVPRLLGTTPGLKTLLDLPLGPS